MNGHQENLQVVALEPIIVNNGVNVNNEDNEQDVEFEPDDEIAELEYELVELIADKNYHDFIEHVVEHKEIVDDEKDTDFEAETSAGGDGVENGADDDDAASDTTTSTLTDNEEIEDASDDVELKIPPEALKEAEKRFPAFWRYKHAMKNATTPDYNPEDDPDYQPPENVQDGEQLITESEWRAKAGVGAEYAASESSTSESDEDEGLMKEEVETLAAESTRDLKDDIDGLVEMVEDMAIPSNVASNDQEEDMEEGEHPEAAPSTIVDFDHEGYNSCEDPDYKPTQDEIDLVAGCSATDSDDGDMREE